MIHGNGVGDGQSLPATTVPETARTVPSHLYPAQVGQLSRELIELIHGNGKVGEAEAAHAEALARVRVARAKAKAEELKFAEANELANEAVKRSRAETWAKSAEAEARFRVARTLEAESIEVARAQRAAKVKMATAEALEADLKIVKLRKEMDVLTGECEVKEFCAFCLSARLCVCLSLPVFLTRTLCYFRILCSPPFSFCFSQQACSRTAEMRSSVARPCC